jgi:hypothetical protein
MTILLQNAIIPSGSILSSGGALEKTNLYIRDGVFDLCEDDTNAEKWDLEGEWLILPGLEHSLYLSNDKQMGLEMIAKAVRKGVTSLVVDDVGRWKQLLSESDYPDLEFVLKQSTSSGKKAQCMINPWQLMKQRVLEFIQQGMELQMALGKALELFKCSCVQYGQDADLIFIQLKAPVNQGKLTDLLFPILMLENEDLVIKAVMKKGQLIYSKYGGSLDSKNFIFDDAFYPQISQKVDSKFDCIETAIRDIEMGKFVVVVDNEDRENEGDLVIAAQDFTPEKAAFMIRYTRYVIIV